jgi:hypothetical protein
LIEIDDKGAMRCYDDMPENNSALQSLHLLAVQIGKIGVFNQACLTYYVSVLFGGQQEL